MGHDPEVPVWPVPSEQAVQTGADDSPEDLFRGRILVDHGLRRLEFGEARGLPHHLGVESQLVAEVIVDGGDIGPGGDA